MPLTALTGQKRAGDGAQITYRSGTLGEIIKSQLHGDLFEQNLRGGQYQFGLSETALVATNAIVTGVSVSAQPLIGLWMPPGSNVAASIISTTIVASTIATSAVNPGGFMWVTSNNEANITVGSTPIRGSDYGSSGARAKAFAMSTPMTGLSGSLTVLRAAAICPGVNANAELAPTMKSWFPTEKVEGSIIVRPGCVVGVMNQASTTGLSVAVGIVWHEVPLTS